MAREWTSEDVMELTRGFQPACVLAAAAELDVFGALAKGPRTGNELAAAVGADPRATRMLADALAAMELLTKEGDRYRTAPGTVDALTHSGSHSVLAMARHLANCLRSWAQLAKVAKDGVPAECGPSILGPEADLASFIEAMDDISVGASGPLVEAIGPPQFTHLLDVGGGPATWTISLLRAMPGATATVFDRPEVIPIARQHVAAAGMEDRVTFVAGDFETDQVLPQGADLAWVSAIVHMNSREQNRVLFAKVWAALAEGGLILVRDVVMDESRTRPAAGAMFAINMLVNTRRGGTFTFGELSEDLVSAGFGEPVLLNEDEFMSSVIQARKP